MKRWFHYLSIFLSINLLGSCQNPSLNKVKEDHLNLIIINEGNHVDEFWKHFENHTKIRVHTQIMNVDSFFLLSSKEGYNMNADVIYMPNVRTLAYLQKKNVLQPLSNLKYIVPVNQHSLQKWHVLGLNPFIIDGELPMQSYSDLKSDGTWKSALTEAELQSFYQFAKFHFKEDKKFEDWKTLMEEKRVQSTTYHDSITKPIRSLTLYNKQNKNPQLTNLMGAGMFYDFSTIGIYPHAKNYTAAQKFMNWMSKPTHLVNIAESLDLVPINYNSLSKYKTFKFHRISPEYLLKSVESSLTD